MREGDGIVLEIDCVLFVSLYRCSSRGGPGYL